MFIDELRSNFEKLQQEIRSGPILPEISAEEIRQHLRSWYDFSKPQNLDDLVGDIYEMLRTWDVQVTHPRYFGLFNPSVTLASVTGEMMAALFNPQLATWRTSPAANEIERHTLSWLTGRFGLPPETRATFTNGGAEANLSAVVVALTRAFPEYGESGARSFSSAPVIYLSAGAHHSFTKIAHMTGLGRDNLRWVATDDGLKMDLADLEAHVIRDRRKGCTPLMVVGTCGTTGTGTIDPLPRIAEFCRRNGLWFHVDAAWGGAAAMSPALRPHISGIEAADSITCDAHKWFSVPMTCGMFFCRHPESVSEAFRSEAAYMPAQSGEDTFDPYTNSVQWSRRFIGLKLFLALAHHGQSGYAEIIERQARLGDLLRRLLIESGWTILNQTPLPLVCFTREGLDVAEFLAALRHAQIAWMSEVRIGNTAAIRACITSYRTTEQDLHRVVGEMNRLATEKSHAAHAMTH